MAKNKFSNSLIQWHEKYGRHDLPWQQNRTPYRVWISEIMLQQTQVVTVIPYFQKFMQRFPTIKSLALAEMDEVLSYWSGLGYYARARNLHKSAQIIHKNYRGIFPDKIELLCELPGIGRSTAGAILSLAMNIAAPILDGNVKRVIARYYAMAGELKSSAQTKELWNLSEKNLPREKVREYNQALMDLGATICTPRNPICSSCPLIKECKSYLENKTHLIPQVKTAKAVPLRTSYFLILMDHQNRIFLQKRPDTGLWASLWSFPLCEVEKDPTQMLEQQLGFKIISTDIMKEFSHKFSHFTLKIKPLRIKVKFTNRMMDSHDQVWYKLRDPLPGGIPKPVSKLLGLMRSK